jgi:hypothetical protein
MATYTVPVNNFTTGFMNENNLGFKPQSEHRGMAKTVLCLEVIFVKYIVMRYMAIVAVSLFTVRAVIPRSVLGGHNMAVNTGLRPVAEIRRSIGYVNREKE